MFFQIFSALISSVAIIYCKNLNFWPLVLWHFGGFRCRLNDIQNNSYSIFITFSDKSNMSISCKRFYNSEFLVWCFWYLKVLELWSAAYMQIVWRWLIKLYFSLILSAVNFFLIMLNLYLSLILLILSILIR